MMNFIFCALILILSACSQRIDPPAPVVDKSDEMFGPKRTSAKLKQEQMISQLIEKYGGGVRASTEEENETHTAWAPAVVSSDAQDSSGAQDESEDNVTLPQPLQKAPVPLKKEVQKSIVEKHPSIAEAPATKPIVAEPVQKEQPVEEKQVEEQDTGSNLIWPVKGKIIKPYGADNEGINIEAREGAPVLAVANGTVAYSTNKLNGFGNLVFIKHPGGLISVYANLKDIHVVKDDKVDQGQKIGTVGKTGNVKTSQLHFELRKNRNASDKKGGKKTVESLDPTTMFHD